MHKFSVDPFQAQLDNYGTGTQIEPIADSVPLANRNGSRKAWRRIIEQAETPADLDDAISALESARVFGIFVPAYSIFKETYDDGYINYTIQAGHVDGCDFERLEPTIDATESYKVLGGNLLRYFEASEKSDMPYLTDIARVDQYVFGQLDTMKTHAPILVDLELHNSRFSPVYQLIVFAEEFILSLEQKSGKRQITLRDQLKRLLAALDDSRIIPQFMDARNELLRALEEDDDESIRQGLGLWAEE